MTKPIFIVEESLRKCPPNLLYGKGPNGETWEGELGTKFIKRHVMRRDKVMFLKSGQTKVEVNVQQNITDIKESFLAKGWDHKEQPLVYCISPDGNEGDEGYHRDAAADAIGWETLLFDQIEYDSPLDQEVSKHNSNNGNPKKENRVKDTVKSVKRVVAKGLIVTCRIKDPEEKQLKDLIARLTPHKLDPYRKKVLKKYRTQDSGIATLVTWDADKINAYCAELKLPFAGDTNYESTGKVGYAKPQGTMKALMHDCMTLIVNDKVPTDDDGNYIPIEIRGFIDDPNPDPKILKRQRTKWLKSLKDDCLDFIKGFYEKTTCKKFDFELPIVFKGFAHQNISPNTDDKGSPIEKEFVLEDWMLEELK